MSCRRRRQTLSHAKSTRNCSVVCGFLPSNPGPHPLVYASSVEARRPRPSWYPPYLTGGGF
jgi:hypothetical protein